MDDLDIDAQLDALVDELGPEEEEAFEHAPAPKELSREECPSKPQMQVTPKPVTEHPVTEMAATNERSTEKSGRSLASEPQPVRKGLPNLTRKPSFAKPQAPSADRALPSVKVAGEEEEAQDKNRGNSQREQGVESAAAEGAMEEISQAKSPVPIKSKIPSRGTIAKKPLNASAAGHVNVGPAPATHGPHKTAMAGDDGAPVTGPKKRQTFKTAYQLFCDELRPQLMVENPKASMPEISKLLATAWRDTSEEDKAAYAAMRAELMANAQNEPPPESNSDATKPKSRAKGRRPGKRKRSSHTDDEENEMEDMERKATPTTQGRKGATHKDVGEKQADEEDQEDEDKMRMNCDWSKNPAAYIIGENTKKGHYLVARKGLPLTEYGIVCSRTAKMQRLGMGDKSCPLPLSLIDDFEAFGKRFRMDVHGAQENNELDLEELPPGSALEMCALLGKLREQGYELASKGKNDIWMKVPLLATCRVLQLIMESERRLGDRAQLVPEP